MPECFVHENRIILDKMINFVDKQVEQMSETFTFETGKEAECQRVEDEDENESQPIEAHSDTEENQQEHGDDKQTREDKQTEVIIIID